MANRIKNRRVAHPGGISNVPGERLKRHTVASLPVVRVATDAHDLIEHEWIVTNGIGGYGTGTLVGDVTRRYHGILVASLPNPLGRIVMLNEIREHVGGEDLPLHGFEMEGAVAVWRYRAGASLLEKRVFMPHRQNTVVVRYTLIEGVALTLDVSPAVHFRPYEAPVSQPLHTDYAFVAESDHFRLTAGGYPALRFVVEGSASFATNARIREQVTFPVEEARGFADRGALWSPGNFRLQLTRTAPAALIASTEPIEVMRAMTSWEALEAERERERRLIAGPGGRGETDVTAARLALAADQFVIKPVGRMRDSVRASAVGDEVRTVIAGYHWFTDWGRDTMISLEGLTLTTGRHREAGFILRTFAEYVRDGLIPNLFPDGSDEGLYHTADATLWFFHAMHRYTEVTGYGALLEQAMPTLRGIIDAHVKGTRFGIRVDPRDGLLCQGAEGYQLTWMDAKVDGWVVTPRRGKAVEINALWYNALSLMAEWERALGDAAHAREYAAAATRARESFNQRFWSEPVGHLYDVIDGEHGDDAACRPNQLFAISLPHAVLDRSRWDAVMGVVQRELLTPVGLRSLSPKHPDYKAKYFGDLRTRDAAYHQGTVWAWLIGPWVDAWLKVHPEDCAGARGFLTELVNRFPDFGVGTIPEIFDAEPPYTPRGCIAQAWSVAEVLRCWVKTGG
jgi:predicted glycogen debranching enzyme